MVLLKDLCGKNLNFCIVETFEKKYKNSVTYTLDNSFSGWQPVDFDNFNYAYTNLIV